MLWWMGAVAAVTMTMSVREHSAQTGKLAVIDVRLDPPNAAVKSWSVNLGTHHGLIVPQDQQRYVALVPIDIEAKAGLMPLSIEALLMDGDIVGRTLDVQVELGSYEKRSITVGKQFTHPSAAQARRAKKEAAEMQAVLRTSSETRLWTPHAFHKPTLGEPTSAFGIQRMYNRKRKSRHLGLDLDGDVGAPIMAAQAGRVVMAHDRFYSGGTVVIDHGEDLFTMYFHMSRMEVHVGDVVAAGSRLGDVGKSGQVTGPHLHFSVKLDDVYVDPAQLLQLSLVPPPASTIQDEQQAPVVKSP
jgi:murein DD-endopeptidase MepM/ murein hydrolase activator NlpD